VLAKSVYSARHRGGYFVRGAAGAPHDKGWATERRGVTMYGTSQADRVSVPLPFMGDRISSVDHLGPTSRVVINAVGRVSDHKVRRDATEHALNVGCHCAVAAEQAMAAEHP
jgi:hypothetical protein